MEPTEFGEGERVRVDIPNESDVDFEYHSQEGEIIEIIPDDAGSITGDDQDSALYRVSLDDGRTHDFRRRDLRPPLGE
jgi:hypothetical protein